MLSVYNILCSFNRMLIKSGFNNFSLLRCPRIIKPIITNCYLCCLLSRIKIVPGVPIRKICNRFIFFICSFCKSFIFCKLLRYALINAAWQTTLVNDTFKDYYDLKISQGRRHYAALGHVAHKLVCVINKMMTDNVEFNLA